MYSSDDEMPRPSPACPAVWPDASTPTRMKPAWLMDE